MGKKKETGEKEARAEQDASEMSSSVTATTITPSPLSSSSSSTSKRDKKGKREKKKSSTSSKSSSRARRDSDGSDGKREKGSKRSSSSSCAPPATSDTTLPIPEPRRRKSSTSSDKSSGSGSGGRRRKKGSEKKSSKDLSSSSSSSNKTHRRSMSSDGGCSSPDTGRAKASSRVSSTSSTGSNGGGMSDGRSGSESFLPHVENITESLSIAMDLDRNGQAGSSRDGDFSAPEGTGRISPLGGSDNEDEFSDEDSDRDDGYYSFREKKIMEGSVTKLPRADEQNVPADSVISWQKGGLIGQGSFGKVFLGLNMQTGELLAVKQISLDEDVPNPEMRKEVEALQREVGILKNLRHDNIVRYYGTSCENDKLNIFLEYVPGGSIFSLLKKFGRFSEEVVAVYTRQLLQGLDYLHRHKIIHRDIKGGNILVDNDGTIKLADFGASRKLDRIVTSKSGVRSLKGTAYWMAPEVIRQRGHGRQADIWSLGCTVIEMATGKPPWAEFGDQVAAMFHIASTNKPPKIDTAISLPCRDFIFKCLQREPKKRPTANRLLLHEFVVHSRQPRRLSDRRRDIMQMPGRKTRSFNEKRTQENHSRTQSSTSRTSKKHTSALPDTMPPTRKIKSLSERRDRKSSSPSPQIHDMYVNPFSFLRPEGTPPAAAGGRGSNDGARQDTFDDERQINTYLRTPSREQSRQDDSLPPPPASKAPDPPAISITPDSTTLRRAQT
eukprot:TRINITY_DN170_c0_g1_i1.p1 TRINITY_DN170_c0_g1~~TRINITY_DN170_c0_g1_i1.p1  ORF type:complete len:723 (-),score=179.86 TRINITY_DN170_c0_g1_i1:58-2226(-)